MVAAPEECRTVAEELSRAIRLTTHLSVESTFAPGWLAVRCDSEATAACLQFAVVAENISARRSQSRLLLPAGPRFRIETEIKNVTEALAKSYHYWDGHLSESQQLALSRAEVVEPATREEILSNPDDYRREVSKVAADIRTTADLPVDSQRYAGWIGIDFPSEEVTVWLLRAIVVDGILVRRERTTLFLPVRAASATDNEKTRRVFRRAWRLWKFIVSSGGE